MSVLMSASLENLSIGSALAYSLLGIVIVFAALMVLWGIINIMASIFKRFRNRGEKPAAAPVSHTPAAVPSAPAAPTAPAAPAAAAGPAAPGSAGDLMIHDVPEKTAAILMAIVANKIGRPLNELRFISIKEVI